MLNENKKLDDPLNELALPNFARLGINHHSPTSLSYPDGVFIYRYLICDQETRRQFEGNANMAAGVAVNNALQYYYAHKIWKHNPLTKKLALVENKKFTNEEAIDKAMEEYRKYNPVDELDQEKFDHYLETIPQTIRQGFIIFNELCGSHHIVCEAAANHKPKGLDLGISGRIDFKVFSEQDLVEEQSPPGDFITPLSVLELKCSFQKGMKRRKDGSRSFSNAKLPSIPHINHLKQISFYHSAARPVVSKLVYLTADGFKVFDKNNCTDLEPVNLNNYYNQLIRTAKRRERLLRRYDHINDTDRIKKELILDTSGGFDHPFYWKIGNRFVQHAKELWSQ